MSREDWRNDALCNEENRNNSLPDSAWWPTGKILTAENWAAVAQCMTCPVITECRLLLGDGEVHGIWAGVVFMDSSVMRQRSSRECVECGVEVESFGFRKGSQVCYRCQLVSVA